MTRRSPNVRALERGLEVLANLNRLGSADSQTIADMTRLPRTTVFRLLETLRLQGYVARSLNEDAYYPTHKVHTLSVGYGADVQLREIAVPVIGSITEEIGWPVGVSTREGLSMIVRESTFGQTPFSVDSMIAGRHLNILNSASGLAYISFCPPDEREVILRNLGRQFTRDQDIGDAYRKIESVRDSGYALHRGAAKPRTVSMGLPIKTGSRVMGCLSTMWIDSAVDTDAAITRFKPILEEATASIQRQIEADRH